MSDVATAEGQMDESYSGWFSTLYREEWEGMVRLAFVIVGNRDVAEELVQDAFTRTYRARSRVVEPLSYLRSAVYNACRNHTRSLAVRRRAPRSEPAGSAEMGDHVIDAVHRLRPRYRALVVLRYYEGLTDSEIAATTGIPLGTVKSSLHRALAELKESLE